MTKTREELVQELELIRADMASAAMEFQKLLEKVENKVEGHELKNRELSGEDFQAAFNAYDSARTISECLEKHGSPLDELRELMGFPCE